MRRELLIIAVMLLAAPTVCAAAQSGRLYCGVYSMYVALHAVGQQPDLERLVDDRYISSPFGSTLADLQRIADDYGVSTVPMKGMTVGMLRDARGPVVLHTRLPRRGSPYRHWIVFLGVDDEMATIVDPPSAPDSIAFSEILAQWDGVGLLVSDKEISSWRAMRAGWLEQANNLAVAACAVLGVAAVLIVRGRRTARFATAQNAVVILLTSLALALGYHALSADGFIRNSGAVASVVTRHHASNVPELSITALESRLKYDPLLIDVRLPNAYAAGSIPGAVSLPISANAAERARFFSSVPQDREVIAFCLSRECGWSDELASDMILRGYGNVSVYRGGYDQWRTIVGSQK